MSFPNEAKSFSSLEMCIVNVLALIEQDRKSSDQNQENILTLCDTNDSTYLEDLLPYVLCLSKCNAQDIAICKIENSKSVETQENFKGL